MALSRVAPLKFERVLLRLEVLHHYFRNMKRRSYTVRARPTSAYGTNDLGVLVDKSEESMEAKLSQQVMTLEMENEKVLLFIL